MLGKSLRADQVNEKLDYDLDDIDGAAAAADDNGSDERAEPRRHLEVAELRVRLPSNGRNWVRVNRCAFRSANRTLDTRLVFPDLTISGRVVQMPRSGGGGGADRCSMILRLRQAGIEFRTTPIDDNGIVDRTGRTGSVSRSVRTDSYFAEPGFISVFAHGCDSLIRRRGGGGRYSMPAAPYRLNSKRKHFQRRRDGGGLDERDLRDDSENADDDEVQFHFDQFERGKSEDLLDSRTFTDWRRPADPWQNVELANAAEQDEAYARELEDLFASGVRGLLTSYMQKALQPAIKETLMESMGYKLSYG